MRLKKKHKRKLKYLFIVIFLTIIGIGSYKYLVKDTEEVDSELTKLMNEYNIDSDKYSKTLEYVLLNNIYNEDYLDEYAKIEFNNESNFEVILTTFLPKGYTGTEINYLFKLSNKNIAYLSNTHYVDISNYYEISNFDAQKIDRYNSYKDHNDLSYQDVVTYVNIGLDIDPYSETEEVSDPDSLLVLVNKYHYLPSGYSPSDIAYLDGAYGNQVPVREVLKESFLELQAAAEEEIGINLMPTTAFRGESFQRTLYNNYVSSSSVSEADTYSARPGYSEHQTGLAIDLRNTALGSNIRLTDENYEWLENNAYKYGFIIRFPEGKENITLYQFENWHIRYVGKDVAKIIYEEDLTLEEYIELYVTEY